MKGFRERSLLFLSSAIIRRKASAFRMPRSPSDEASEIGLKVTPLLPERRAFTIPSLDQLASWIESSDLLIASDLRGEGRRPEHVGRLPGPAYSLDGSTGGEVYR